jgi:hypothetical protein
MLMTPTANSPRLAPRESLDLEQLFPNPGTCVFRMTADAPLFLVAAGDYLVVEFGADLPRGNGALMAVRREPEAEPRVRRVTAQVGGRVLTLASGVPGERDEHLPTSMVHLVGRVVGVIRRYAL